MAQGTDESTAVTTGAAPMGGRQSAAGAASEAAEDALKRHRSQTAQMKKATVEHWQSKRARRANVVIFVLVIVLIAAATVSFMLGRYPIAPAQVGALLVSQVIPVDQIWTNQQADIFFGVRLPRVLMAILVGCCLSVAGATYQRGSSTRMMPTMSTSGVASR